MSATTGPHYLRSSDLQDFYLSPSSDGDSLILISQKPDTPFDVAALSEEDFVLVFKQNALILKDDELVFADERPTEWKQEANHNRPGITIREDTTKKVWVVSEDFKIVLKDADDVGNGLKGFEFVSASEK